MDLTKNKSITDKGIQNLLKIRKLNLALNENITDRGIQNLTQI